MSRDELMAELTRRQTYRLDATHVQLQTVELETYREEVRIQTDQLIEAQRELEDSRDRYADLYDSAPVAYLTLDEHGVIRDANLASASLLELSRERLLGLPFVRLVVEDQRREWLNQLQSWPDNEARDILSEVSLRRASGEFPASLMVRKIHRFEKPVYRVALLDQTEKHLAEERMRDINTELESRVRQRTSELEAVNDQLLAADQRKNEFLAMLSHELRNPLASIANGIAILNSEGTSPVNAKEATGIMERQLNNVIGLLNDLLDVSRVTQGKINLHWTQADLNDVARSAVESCTPLLRSRDHRLEVHLPQQPSLLRCDPTRIEQILVNLLNNAAKYTPAGGRVELTVSRDQGLFRIEVRDSGLGMTSDMLHDAFELFNQATWTMDRAQGGLGIGLTMVRSLAELHGGRVWAESEGLGRGCLVTVELPAKADASSEDREPAAPQLSADRVSHRIAVIEDNVDAAHLLKQLLSLWGHEVAVAHDGESGLDLIMQMAPRVAFVDIGLPKLNGLEVARQIRQRPNCHGLLLVAMTGYGSDDDRERAREAGFDRHLTKPVAASSLEELLQGIPSG